ncbi:MAG: PH domain-containing protein [Steroidobacteraceae bacterium]
MIALNTRHGLPPNALWYWVVRSALMALLVVAFGSLFHLGLAQPSCRGLLCGNSSGNALFIVVYLYAALLVLRALVNYRYLSFLITDKSILIESGLLVRSSRSFRFDRIQDTQTRQGPLRSLLGLKSVAIWTGSPDQWTGKSKQPDGQLLLTAADADWLRDYLSGADGSAARAAPAAAPSPAAARTDMGLVPLLIVAAIIALPLIALWKSNTKTPVASTSTAATGTQPEHPPAAALAGAPAAPAAATAAAVRAASIAAVADNTYSIACSIHEAGGPAGVTACADLAEGRRCSHEADYPSLPTAQAAQLTIVNRSQEDLRLYWMNPTGGRALYAALKPGGRVRQSSHTGAHWMVSARDASCIGIFDAGTITVGIF